MALNIQKSLGLEAKVPGHKLFILSGQMIPNDVMLIQGVDTVKSMESRPTHRSESLPSDCPCRD